MTGRLIVFEGADGLGKSTQARRLADRLGARLTHQLGGTRIGAAIREILLNPHNSELDDLAEAMLVVADKAQHVAEIVVPALARGETVISDRFSASALGYQGYGRGIDLLMLEAIIGFATHRIEPDLTVLLDTDAESALAPGAEPTDRIEAADASFHRRVRQGFRKLASLNPHAWVVISAEGTVEQVGERVDLAVDAWFDGRQ